MAGLSADLIVTRPQAVRLLGLSGRTFDRLVQEGVLVPLERGAGRRPATYEAPAMVAAYVAYRERRSGYLDLQAERAALARSQREKVDLDVAARRRELVPREESERGWRDYVLQARARLLALPALALVRGVPHEAVGVFDELLRSALEAEASEEAA